MKKLKKDPMKPRKSPTRCTCLIVDANNLACRAYFGVRGLETSDGVPTNAIYGVLQSLKTLVWEYVPRRVYIIWDAKGKTWRHELVESLRKEGLYKRGYKAGRVKDKDWVDNFLPQIKKLQEIIPLLGYFQFIGHTDREEFFEADDIIASVACALQLKEFMHRIIIVSNDDDFLQMLQFPKIRIAKPNKKGKYKLWGPKRVMKEWGVEPKKMIAIGALMGDATDNIEGIEGVGPKTAAKIIRQCKSLKRMYRMLKAGQIIVSKGVTDKLRGTKTKVAANYRLKKLRLDVEGLSQRPSRNLAEARRILHELEIREISPLALAKNNMDLVLTGT